ncbi:MAG: tetraacyldisaccharide 4'-kinase [Deltaproteobacteria bacterium]|nr:tetraacyldisaccharide 4'-kinase [Deltaproteobacteria bacterium]
MLLKSLSAIYQAVTGARNLLYDRGVLKTSRCGLPVISIGNIQAGGSGKTPLVIFMAGELKQRGRRPVVLSRGYGAKVVRPMLVDKASSFDVCGDEPLLIARCAEVPVVVSPDRVAGAALIENQQLGDVIVLDDGFQHRRLKRDIDIVLINAGSPSALKDFLENRLLPYGSLREDRNKALKRADLAVISTRQPSMAVAEEAAILRLLPKRITLFKSYFEGKEVAALANGSKLEPCEVAAFCGIANPDAFFATLSHLGFKVIHKKVFRDHFRFHSSDIAALRKQFPAHPLVCTEKDAVRISADETANLFVLKGRARIVPADAFMVQVMKAL